MNHAAEESRRAFPLSNGDYSQHHERRGGVEMVPNRWRQQVKHARTCNDKFRPPDTTVLGSEQSKSTWPATQNRCFTCGLKIYIYQESNSINTAQKELQSFLKEPTNIVLYIMIDFSV